MGYEVKKSFYEGFSIEGSGASARVSVRPPWRDVLQIATKFHPAVPTLEAQRVRTKLGR